MATSTNRIMTLVRSTDRLGPGDDPGRVLDSIIFEMRMQLHEAKKQVCVAMADERVLRRHVDRHVQEAAGWERRAMMAVRAGDDNLARAALQRKTEQDELAATYQAQWHDQNTAVENLRMSLRALDQRIADAARQRNLLVARASRAHAQRTIAATLANINGVSAWSPLERLEDRVMQLESEVDAVVELGGDELSLEAQFAALERGNVDDELAALKRRMLADRPRRALPAAE
jgi:phage shock protein A